MNFYPRGIVLAYNHTIITHYPINNPQLVMAESKEYSSCKVQADWENPPLVYQYRNEEEDYQGRSRFNIYRSIIAEIECMLNYSEDPSIDPSRKLIRTEEKSKEPSGKISMWLPRHSSLRDKNAYIAVESGSL